MMAYDREVVTAAKVGLGSIVYKCAGPRNEETMRRAGCGCDLTVLIEKVPADGKDHQVTCPKCKNKTVVMKGKPQP